jgi:glycosyltransferase involved in cell wall biosynthesis
VGAHEDLMMNYYRHFSSGRVCFDFVLRRGGRDFRYREDPAFDGSLHYLTPLSESRRRWAQELRSVIKAGSYSHVHLHSGWANAIGVIAAMGMPVVRITHAHSEYPVSTRTVKLRNQIARTSITTLSNVRLACSDNAGRQMFGAGNFCIIPNVIEYAKFQFEVSTRSQVRASLGLTDDDLVVGHVGAFIPVKNHAFMLDVLRHLHENHPTAKLLLVGSGEENRTAVHRLVESSGLAEHVVLAGQRTDVSEFLCAMDIFLFPSLFEGFGMALLEAQVNGLRCFYSDSIPTEAVISEDQSALSLTDGARSWAQVIGKALIQRPDTGFRRQARSLSTPVTYDASAHAQVLEDIYLKGQLVQ